MLIKSLSRFILACTLSQAISAISFAQTHEIAITIDDLPFVGSANGDVKKLGREKERFMKILQALVDNHVPATGFVIAHSIEPGQWDLLEQFKNAGFIIANHTYTHANLNHMTAEKYIEEIEKADKVLAPLMSPPKYFRYPYLAEGKNEKKEQVQNFLTQNQYIIAPVTIDSKDYQFNAELLAIHWRNRAQHLNSFKKRYLNYIWNQTLKAEKHSHGPEDKQILLIHANYLNSFFLGDIIKMYKDHGYVFITLPEALKRPAQPINQLSTTSSQEPATQKTVAPPTQTLKPNLSIINPVIIPTNNQANNNKTWEQIQDDWNFDV